MNRCPTGRCRDYAPCAICVAASLKQAATSVDPSRSTRCTLCAAEFSDEELRDASSCPGCGTESLPMAIADDVQITINWHELRVLGMWSSNWAAAHFPATDSAKALASILHRIACQHPEKAAVCPLTLAGEVGQLRHAIEDGELPGFSGLETNVRDLLEEPEE